MPNCLCSSLLSKTDEQLERTSHLIPFIPDGRLSWTPGTAKAFPVGVLLGHLLECCSGFCAVLHAAKPAALEHFIALKSERVNHDCTPSEALKRIAGYASHIHHGFGHLVDADLSISIPTVFVPAGELLLTLLLGNLEHLINHKHQLFMYLQLMGAGVSSSDLYRFRS